MDDAEQLMPAYLRFVRGIIDSNDLPLNVSREILQQSRDVQTIRAASVKRVLGLLDDLAEQPRRRSTRRSGRSSAACSRKASPRTPPNRERIAKLLRFASTHERQRRADRLARRLRRPDEGGPGRDLLHHRRRLRRRRSNSPHLEIFRKLGVEVLLMYDRVDEWVVSPLTEFEGKPLQSVAKGDLDLSKLGGERREGREQEHGRRAQGAASSACRRR